MLKKRQNGFVIEIMIAFMFVTFGFCLVITTYLGTLRLDRKHANNTVQMQANLNQIGEYYLRCIQSSKEFPKGTEDNFDKFDWMDESTKEFFENNKNKGYTYDTLFSIKRGNIWEFYVDKYIMRKLIVKSGNKNKLVVIVKETMDSKSKHSYEILDWSVGNDVNTNNDGYKSDKNKLNLLQKLWKLFGLSMENVEDFKKIDKKEYADVIELLIEEIDDMRLVFFGD